MAGVLKLETNRAVTAMKCRVHGGQNMPSETSQLTAALSKCSAALPSSTAPAKGAGRARGSDGGLPARIHWRHPQRHPPAHRLLPTGRTDFPAVWQWKGFLGSFGFPRAALYLMGS